TFPFVMPFWGSEGSGGAAGLPIEKLRGPGRAILHGEQAFEYFRWPKVGDVLEGTSEIVDVYEKEKSGGGKLEFYVQETTCTDQFDLAGLCVAHAARDTDRRQYDVALDPDGEGLRPRLWRDGTLVLEWTISDGRPARVLVDPVPPFDDAPWRGGFIRWADAT